MANPILSRSEAFTRPPTVNPYQGQTYAPQGYQQAGFQPGYAQPGYPQPGYQQPGYQQPGYGPQGQPQGFTPNGRPVTGTMTFEDVLVKSAIALGTTAAFAIVGALFVPMQFLLMLTLPAAVIATVLAIIVSSRRVVSPVAVLAFAALEGILVGGISAYFEQLWGGIVGQAVMATFIAAGATLAAYKFFNIRVGTKFRKVLTVGSIGFIAVILVNLVMSFANINVGIREVGGNASLLSMGFSLIAMALGVMSLIADFDQIERGVANRAPAQESWRAALGITATLVFLYLELLRILSYFRN